MDICIIQEQISSASLSRCVLRVFARLHYFCRLHTRVHFCASRRINFRKIYAKSRCAQVQRTCVYVRATCVKRMNERIRRRYREACVFRSCCAVVLVFRSLRCAPLNFRRSSVCWLLCAAKRNERGNPREGATFNRPRNQIDVYARLAVVTSCALNYNDNYKVG